MTDKKDKKIAIIGAGITGLALGFWLSKKGFKVTIFEKRKVPGGFLETVRIGNSRVERYYHHIFKNDTFVLDLLKKLGLIEDLNWFRSTISIYTKGRFFKLMTPWDFLKLPFLSPITKIRLGLAMLYLKNNKNWGKFSQVTVKDWITKIAGREAWDHFWGPLFYGKFEEKASLISAAWFWSRVHIRVNSREKNREVLGYLKGSFGKLIAKLIKEIKKNQGKVRLDKEVLKIERLSKSNQFSVETQNKKEIYDIVVSTINPYELIKISQFNRDYQNELKKVSYLGIICLLLVLKEKQSKYYWNNIFDSEIPFKIILEHTNFSSAKNYKGNYLVYLGQYCNPDSKLFRLPNKKLKEIYISYLTQIFPEVKSKIKKVILSKSRYAQPIIEIDYQKLSNKTPLRNFYITSLSHIYPEDRGINAGLKEVKKITDTILSEVSPVKK